MTKQDNHQTNKHKSRTKNSNAKGPFSLHFDECLEALELRNNGKKADKKEIAALLGVAYETFKRYINSVGDARRDCIIAIGFALWLSSNQTDDLLLRYNMPKLDEEVPREQEIIRMLNVANTELIRGEKKVDDFSLDSINQELMELNMAPLHVVDKKTRSKGTEEHIHKQQPKYVLLDQKTETRIDEIVLGDWHESLMTEYFPGRYRISSDFYIESIDRRSGHRIVVEPGNNTTYSELIVETDKPHTWDRKPIFLQWDYPSANGLATSFSSLEETGELKSFFKIAYNKAIQERIRLTQVLNDSRNYPDRISARVIDGELHVFTETYNYDYPEMGEYYLMDSYNNRFIFSVEKTSCFMLLYLTPNEYLSYFDRFPDRGLERYESEEDIKDKREKEKDWIQAAVLGSRMAAYRQMKQRIEEFIPKLNTSIYIRHPDTAIDEDTNIFDYYGTKPDSGYTEADLMQAYVLGLDSIYEIELYRQKSNALKMNHK